MKSTYGKKLLPIALFGYAFLYIPLILVILFSFNDSKFISVWTGFSLQWYEALLADKIILHSLWVSLRLAAISATLAVVLGTIAAMVAVRMRKFWGKDIVSSLASVPLVLPDVMMGLALLILYVSIGNFFGWPKTRGISTITIAHATLGLAYVFVIVRSRLLTFNQALEEAALDLGARPMTVFWQITLPIIFPSLLSAWLLAFILSFDDVVLASFLSGPGSTTLPMVIFSSIRLGISPIVNALATLMILTISVGIILFSILQKKK